MSQWSFYLGMSLFAGVLQGGGVDRWQPLSILAWQRGWNSQRTWRLTWMWCVGQVLIMSSVLMGWTLLARLFHAPSLTLVSAGAIATLIAFWRVLRLHQSYWREGVLTAGHQGVWGRLQLLKWLGPTEYLLPIFAFGDGVFGGGDAWVGVLAFTLGYGLSLGGLSALALGWWDEPLRLAKELKSPHLAWSAVSLTGVVLVGLILSRSG